MAKVLVTRTLAVSAERAWTVFTNLSDRPSWMSTVDSVELLAGLGFGPGTAWRESRGGVTQELTVTAAEAGRACTVTSAAAGAQYRLTWTFTPAPIGSRTVVSVVSDVVRDATPGTRADRILLLLLGGLATRAMESSLRAELAALAAACEPVRSPRRVTRELRRKGDPRR